MNVPAPSNYGIYAKSYVIFHLDKIYISSTIELKWHQITDVNSVDVH